jgi:hypothetical protein
MCKYLTFCWRPHNDASNNEQVVRKYKVPPELKWCPKCSKNDPEKMIIWMKYVCTELYKENESIAKTINYNISLGPFTDNINQLNGLYAELASFNIWIRKQVADILIDEKIEIIAPFLTSSRKRAIKKKLGGISKTKDIVKLVSDELGDGHSVTVERSKNIIIRIITTKTMEECQVCFSASITDKPRCKTCKNCYTCKSCETESLAKYKRCAFCNTEF